MIIEWPVALLFFIFSGLCAAYAHHIGSKEIEKEYRSRGAENLINVLIEHDIITFEDDGTIIGKNNKRFNPLND